MDPRVIPEEYLDFGEMEMAVIRNAGGRAPDAMRSLRCLDAISGFGTGHLDLVVVIHHTDCGLTNFDNEFIENRVKENAPEKHKHEIDGFDFGEIKNIDEAVRDDVAYIKRDQFIPKDVLVLGYVYDVFSGKLREVK
ncbi:MAG: hypothetical protein MMC23_002229 [Stictis urceolatum]|nr:hypothetical protein [Stictis urceolata]